jgi:acyl-CoA thioesterase
VTQARAVGSVGNREILTVNAALGVRPLERHDQWETIPLDVPPPGSSPPRWRPRWTDGNVHERVDLRLAGAAAPVGQDDVGGPGRTLLWARIPEVIEGVDAAALAVLGDFVPIGVSQGGDYRGGASLDNTLRVVRLVPTHWVLLDIRLHAVDHGFGHGLVHMFAEDGTLLATASQSCVVRAPTPAKERAR